MYESDKLTNKMNVGLTAEVEQMECGLGKVYLRSGRDILAIGVG